MKKQFIFDAVSEETSKVTNATFRKQETVERTWLEFNEEKGFRSISQIQNPKTKEWGAPKKSPYAFLGVLVLIESKISMEGVPQNTTKELVDNFVKEIGGVAQLSQPQLKRISELYSPAIENKTEEGVNLQTNVSIKWEIDTFTGKNKECILTSNKNISDKACAFSLNTLYNLENLKKLFENKGKLSIKMPDSIGFSFIDKNSFIEWLNETKIIPVLDTFKPYTPAEPKAKGLAIKKGDRVHAKIDGNDITMIGVIIKYSSNKEITIDNMADGDNRRTAIVSKEDIIEVM